MATDKNKLDFNKLRNRKKTEKAPPTQKMYKEVKQVPKKEANKPTSTPPKKKVTKEDVKVLVTNKVGRKSWKEKDVKYTRISFDVPIETRQKLKILLATNFFDVYTSQDEMINVAINDFITKHSK